MRSSEGVEYGLKLGGGFGEEGGGSSEGVEY